jgi:hypothetical protein
VAIELGPRDGDEMAVPDSIQQHFALPRHRMSAAIHRAQLKARLHAWYDWAGVQLFNAD